MRVLLALLCLLPALCDAQAVARTGDNAIKIPLDVNGKRITYVAPPVGGGGTLQLVETFDTAMSFPNFPYNAPYSSHFSSVGDPGCVRSVSNSVWADGTFAGVFDFAPADTGSNHCMVVDQSSGSKLNRGQAYWIGWEWNQITGGWAPVCTPDGGAHPYCTINGGHEITFQLHGSGPAGENPPVNFDAGNGPGHPWKIIVQAKNTLLVPTAQKHVTYETCGNVVTGQADIWIAHVIPSGTSDTATTGVGVFDLYRGGVSTPPALCIHDVGLNDNVANALGLYMSWGDYHGEGSRAGSPQGRRVIVIDQIRRGRELDGVFFNDVVPR